MAADVPVIDMWAPIVPSRGGLVGFGRRVNRGNRQHALLLFCFLGAYVRFGDPPPPPARAPLIVLKMDDLTPTRDGQPRQTWRRLADYLEKKRLKAGFGIICASLEANAPAYFEWIQAKQRIGLVEFWLHGHHERTAKEKTGEFEHGSAEEQRAVLERCEQLAEKNLGFALTTFGPHWSGTTAETEKAVQAVPEIKVWLYGPKDSPFYRRLSIERVMTLEEPIFVPDFEKFKAAYRTAGAKERVLVLQGHPHAWDESGWSGFFAIVEFLERQGCRFATPMEVLDQLSRNPRSHLRTTLLSVLDVSGRPRRSARAARSP